MCHLFLAFLSKLSSFRLLTSPPFAHVLISPTQVKKLQEEKFKPLEQLTLEPYERDHAVVVATYRPAPKTKK